MNLRSLSRPFRRSLVGYLRRVMRKRQPEIDALEQRYQAARAAHRSTAPIRSNCMQSELSS